MSGRRRIWWSAVAIASILAATSGAAEGGFRRYLKLSNEVRQLKAQNEKLSAENVRLRRDVDLLREDRVALERASREELGFVRPGELVFSVEAP